MLFAARRAGLVLPKCGCASSRRAVECFSDLPQVGRAVDMVSWPCVMKQCSMTGIEHCESKQCRHGHTIFCCQNGAQVKAKWTMEPAELDEAAAPASGAEEVRICGPQCSHLLHSTSLIWPCPCFCLARPAADLLTCRGLSIRTDDACTLCPS